MTDDKDPMVHHPAHYTVGGFEMLDVFEAKLTREQVRGFYLANSLKYLFRADHKGSCLQDLEKAAFYLQRLIQLTKDNQDD